MDNDDDDVKENADGDDIGLPPKEKVLVEGAAGIAPDEIAAIDEGPVSSAIASVAIVSNSEPLSGIGLSVAIMDPFWASLISSATRLTFVTSGVGVIGAAEIISALLDRAGSDTVVSGG